MTRKDYELIAATLRTQREELDTIASSTNPAGIAELRTTVSGLARAFAADNPRFDAARFTKAAGF